MTFLVNSLNFTKYSCPNEKNSLEPILLLINFPSTSHMLWRFLPIKFALIDFTQSRAIFLYTSVFYHVFHTQGAKSRKKDSSPTSPNVVMPTSKPLRDDYFFFVQCIPTYFFVFLLKIVQTSVTTDHRILLSEFISFKLEGSFFLFIEGVFGNFNFFYKNEKNQLFKLRHFNLSIPRKKTFPCVACLCLYKDSEMFARD